MSPRANTRGPLVAAALAAPLEPGEKRRVLIGLAMLLEQRPGGDVSIGELRRTTHLHRMNLVMKLDRLAVLGLIAIERGDDATEQRSRYRLLLPDFPDQITTKETSMTTKAHTPILKTDVLPAPLQTGWLPEMKAITWDTYNRHRAEHESAIEEFIASAGDVRAEGEALRRICDVVEVAAVELPNLVESEGTEALQRRREELEQIGRADAPPAMTSGITLAEVKARASNSRIDASGPLAGLDLRQLGLDARHDESVLGEMSTFGSGSRVARGLEPLPEVRRLVREALAEVD